MVFNYSHNSRGFRRGGIVVHGVGGGALKRDLFITHGKARNIWETFNMVIIRERPFFRGRGSGLGYEFFFLTFRLCMNFFGRQKGVLPLQIFFQHVFFSVQNIWGGFPNFPLPLQNNNDPFLTTLKRTLLLIA